MDLVKRVQKLGLNENEAKVYIATLELGEGTVQQISQRAGVKRITTHVIVEKLIAQKLLSEEVRGKRRVIVAEIPHKLLDVILDRKMIAEHQLNEMMKLLPELESIYNVLSSKPRVFFYQGLEGIKKIYEDTLREGEEILAFTGYGKLDPELKKWLHKYYIPLRVKKNVYAKVIAPSTKSAKSLKKLDKKHKREIVIVPEREFPFTIELNIYTNRVAIMSFTSKEMLGLIVESQEVANTFRLIFKLAWMAAKSMSGEIKK